MFAYDVFAYNVYIGKYWDGEWYTATRKFAVPINARFWSEHHVQHTNTLFVRPNVKLSKVAK